MAAVTICNDFGMQKIKVWHWFHYFPICLLLYQVSIEYISGALFFSFLFVLLIYLFFQQYHAVLINVTL